MGMNKEITIIKYCNWCGDPFEVKSPNQKYCPSDEKDCSKEAKRESWRKASNNYRNNYKNVLNISQVYKLGSGWLSSTPKNDFNEEYLAIQKEKKRLNINSIAVGLPLWIQMTAGLSMRNFLPRVHFSIGEIWPLLIVLLVFIIFVLILGYHYK
jgi:hypothetical protein